MSSKLKDLLEIEKLKSKRPLLAHLLYILFFIVGIYWVLNLLDIKDDTLLPIIIFIGIVVALASYLNETAMPKFSDDEIGIILAFNEKDENVNNVLEKIYANLAVDFRKHKNLSFRIKKIFNRNNPTNIEEAHEMRRKTNATLIFWGSIDRGKEGGNEAVILNPIHFTYAVHDPFHKDKVIEDPYLNSIQWKIRESDDCIDTEYVSKNISNFSRFIISLSLASKKNIEDSMSIIKRLIMEVRSLGDEVLEKRVQELYAFCMNIKINFFVSPQYKDRDNEIRKAEFNDIVREMIEIDNKNPGAYLLQGIINFFNNKIDDAKNSIVLAKKYSSYKDSSPYYSMAFLQFIDEKMEAGWQNLKDTFGMQPFEHVNRVVSFYEDVLEKEPSKKMLNLPLGILYFEELEEIGLAKQNIEEFLQNFTLGNKQWEKEIKVKCDEILNKK